jgi:hypothetical protein
MCNMKTGLRLNWLLFARFFFGEGGKCDVFSLAISPSLVPRDYLSLVL